MQTGKHPLGTYFNLDIVFSTLCMLFFVVMLIETFRMDVPSTYLLPRALSILGIILVAAIWLTNLKKIMARVVEFEEEKKGFGGLNFYLNVLITGAYFFIANFLGYIPTTFICILAFVYIMRYQNKAIAFATAIFLPLILYYLFASLLKVSLPQGFLEALFI